MVGLILSCPFRAYDLIYYISPRLCLRAELIWAFSPKKARNKINMHTAKKQPISKMGLSESNRGLIVMKSAFSDQNFFISYLIN